MPILTIRHVTAYHYKQPVAFGEHRIMLRPRDDEDQKILQSELEIAPEPSQLSWTRDVFGNHVATARFADRASELRFESTIRLEHTPAGFPEADIQDFARTYPFAYGTEDRTGLALSGRGRCEAYCAVRRMCTSDRRDRPRTRR